MSERTKAIVLNRIKYSDSSIIVKLFTQKYGRVSAIIKACRGKNAKIKANKFFPLNILELDLHYKENRELQFVKTANQNCLFFDITNNIVKTCIAQFISEIIQKTVKEEATGSDEVFEFLENAIFQLENTKDNIGNFNLVFLTQFAEKLGFKINNNLCLTNKFFNLKEGMFIHFFTCQQESMSQTDSLYLSNILKADFTNFHSITIPYNNRKIILNSLLEYYKYHISGNYEFKSIRVLNEIFE